MKNILLIVPPFFTPFTPPLGVSLLKRFLQDHGHQVRCLDLNINALLWDMHHNYFALIDRLEGNHLDGYSLYWYILNPHMLAFVNNATREECEGLIQALLAKYSLRSDPQIIAEMIQLVEDYFQNLQQVVLTDLDVTDYHFVGTSTYSTSLASSLFIHKVIKENHPEVTTLMGGGVFADDLAIGTKNLQTLLDEYDYIDKIVIGEGELLTLKVIEGEFARQRVIGLQDIDQEIMNIQESVLPDFSDFEIKNYYHMTIEGSRSCPFQCKFCSERIQWGKYRKKEAEFLARQLVELKQRHNKNTFFLGDSLINLYVEDLSKELLKHDEQVFFDGYLRAEPPVAIRENTQLWAKAGLYRVRLGMESGSPAVLKLMNKKISPEIMREVLKSLSSAGIRPTTYWVVGFPGETEEDFQQTLDFITENHQYIYELEAHPYYYYPSGQGISEDYNAESLYTDEVRELVRFDKYDIKNANPSREERFSRLKRLSDHVRKLGIFNIYSAQDLFKAEERWLSLYPEAKEIYKGTRKKQVQPELNSAPVPQNEDEAYWFEKLSGIAGESTLPVDYPRTNIANLERAEYQIALHDSLYDKLTKISKNVDSLLFTILMAGLKICVSKYSRNLDTVIGTTIQRKQSEFKALNKLLAVRDLVDPEMTFKQLLLAVKDSLTGAYEHLRYPFKKLLTRLDIETQENRSPLFDIILLLENINEPENVAGLANDLTITFTKTEQELVGTFSYNNQLFDRSTIERFATHLVRVLDLVTDRFEIKIGDVNLLAEAEEEQLLHQFNQTHQTDLADRTLIDLFREQVAQTPEQIAISLGEEHLTYRELDERANNLARLLRERGVGPDQIVGLICNRSIEMIVGIMGILTAGGAYLPLDAEYPTERVEYILQECQVQTILAHPSLLEKIDFNGEVIDLNDEQIYTGSGQPVEQITQPNHLAYIIFTSGSTGKPKGVMIEHRNVANSIYWRKEEYQLTTADHVLQLFSFSFDGFVTSFFTPIISGARVVLLTDDEAKDVLVIKKAIVQEKITHFICVPSLYAALLECLTAEDGKNLRVITLAGEKVLPTLVEKTRKLYPVLELVNEYGPTENSVITTFKRHIEADEQVLIGQPIANTQVYILDEQLRLVPVGVSGELCIAGAGLARGYLNNPELTAKSFCEHPYQPGTRLYRTGDLARILPDGNVEFMGRIDNQVKIRGFRIEIGEIETILASYPTITDSVVLAIDDDNGNKYLCAYLVSTAEVEIADLKEFLKKELPEYMIPTYYVPLAALPMTVSGKVDRNRLPLPESVKQERRYVAPRTQIEKKLATIWAEVLRADRVGIDDNFVDLGGHSLKATLILAKIYKEINVEIMLHDIYAYPTIRELAEYMETAEVVTFTAIPQLAQSDYYPVSSAQKRLYAVHQIEEKGTLYNTPTYYRVSGDLDLERLNQTFNQLVQRHEAFRTSFEIIDGELVQRIQDHVALEIKSVQGTEDQLDELAAAFVRPFDLSQAPLIRVELVELVDGYFLMLDTHHIIADGMSMGILISEFIDLYNGRELPELRIQYKDFSVWQNQLITTEGFKQQEAFWLETFATEPPVLELPTDYPRTARIDFTGDTVQFKIPADWTEQLKELAAQSDATLYMVLLAMYNVLLYKLTGQEDIVVGSPIMGRPHADVEQVIGMFINTLAMRNYPQGNKSFTEFLTEVKEQAFQAFQHQDYQFEMLVEQLDLARDISRNPVFETMFVLQNIDQGPVRIAGLEFTPYEVASRPARFDLTLMMVETDEGLVANFDYSTELFKRETIEHLTNYLLRLVESVLTAPAAKIADLALLSISDRQLILEQFNQTETAYPGEGLLHQLFEEQVELTPTQVAVSYGGQSLTYSELNAKANQLARALKKQGAEPEQVVGLMVENSLEMAIGLLGILKAGAAYLPIDLNHPAERIQYLVEDCGCKLFLTQTQFVDQVQFAGEVMDLNDLAIYQGDSTNLAQSAQPENLAYVIYTSGSTGQPKGVLVEHQSIVNTIYWRKEEYQLTSEDRVLQLFSYTFDGFITSFFTPLLSGAQVIMTSEETVKDPVLIKEMIRSAQITHFIAVPSLYSALLELLTADDLATVRRITLAGEQVTPSLVEKTRHLTEELILSNEYGPTENSVASTMESNLVANEQITIGTPIANTQVYIVDQDLNPVPIGVTGQLVLAGSGLARGYHNLPQETARAFVANPFGTGDRMYLTGDLAKWLPDGRIQMLGRIDHQVKIRGYRIETGEIEGHLMAYPGVKEAVVVGRDDAGRKYLCAYVVSSLELDQKELKAYLATKLPNYMIPSYLVTLPELPVTTSGKVNHHALPNPLLSESNQTTYVAPTTKLEKLLAELWADCLGITKPIGIHDHFFELGGDSIKGMQIVAKLHQQGYACRAKDLFTYPELQDLAKMIGAEGAGHAVVAEQGILSGEMPLSPLQIKTFNENLTNPDYYCVSVLFKLETTVDYVSMAQAFHKLIEHHDALRLNYNPAKQTFFYNNQHLEQEFDLVIHDLQGLAVSEQASRMIDYGTKLKQSLDLENGLLCKACVFELSPDERSLLVVMHHMVTDAVSVRIVAEDLFSLYSQINSSKEGTLPQKSTSYNIWIEKLYKYSQDPKIVQERSHWEEILGTDYTMTIDFDHGPDLFQHYGTLEGSLSKEETELLLTGVNQMYQTKINDLLLTALALTMNEYEERTDLIVEMESHGREEFSEQLDLSRTVGWFTSIYPVKFDLADCATLEDQIATVQSQLNQVPNGGLGYCLLKYLHPQGLQAQGGDYINFNYLGRYDQNQADHLFGFDPRSHGQDFDPKNPVGYKLSVTSSIVEDRLSVMLIYSENKFGPETIERLLALYLKNLRAIINHCKTSSQIA